MLQENARGRADATKDHPKPAAAAAAAEVPADRHLTPVDRRLLRAIMSNNSAQVRRCVADRGSANTPFCAGKFSRPLHVAVQWGRPNIVATLLALNARAIAKDYEGLDAFERATHALKFFTDTGCSRKEEHCAIRFPRE
jgi:hypothetical protein